MSESSFDSYYARMAVVEAMAVVQSPSVLYRPRIFADGDHWCCLLGDDLQVGIAGFGKTPYEACCSFDDAFSNARTPAAMLKAATLPQDQDQGWGAMMTNDKIAVRLRQILELIARAPRDCTKDGDAQGSWRTSADFVSAGLIDQAEELLGEWDEQDATPPHAQPHDAGQSDPAAPKPAADGEQGDDR